jgi:hypothetical protein
VTAKTAIAKLRQGWLLLLPQSGWVWFKAYSIRFQNIRVEAFSQERNSVYIASVWQEEDLTLFLIRHIMRALTTDLFNNGRIISSEGGWSGADSWMWEEGLSLGVISYSQTEYVKRGSLLVPAV